MTKINNNIDEIEMLYNKACEIDKEKKNLYIDKKKIKQERIDHCKKIFKIQYNNLILYPKGFFIKKCPKCNKKLEKNIYKDYHTLIYAEHNSIHFRDVNLDFPTTYRLYSCNDCSYDFVYYRCGSYWSCD